MVGTSEVVEGAVVRCNVVRDIVVEGADVVTFLVVGLATSVGIITLLSSSEGI